MTQHLATFNTILLTKGGLSVQKSFSAGAQLGELQYILVCWGGKYLLLIPLPVNAFDVSMFSAGFNYDHLATLVICSSIGRKYC